MTEITSRHHYRAFVLSIITAVCSIILIVSGITLVKPATGQELPNASENAIAAEPAATESIDSSSTEAATPSQNDSGNTTKPGTKEPVESTYAETSDTPAQTPNSTKDAYPYPETGSDEWNALSDEEKLAASNAFYGMDPALKRYYELKPGQKDDDGFTLQVWRKHPETGELVRLPITAMRAFCYPGETLYFFFKIDAHAFNNYNRTRIGWGFHNQNITPAADGAEGHYKLDPFYTYMKPQNVMLDGRPVDRWNDKSDVYGETDTSPYPAPKSNVPEQGHVVIEPTVAPGVIHYISFEYTLPQNLWYAAFSYGDGADGQSGNHISARAQGFRIYPIGEMDVRYVKDSDYRQALGIEGEEDVNPIKPRETTASYQIIDALEDKQIAPKSKVYADGYGETLFPLDTTFRKYDENGEIRTYDYKYFMAGADAYVGERPTYEELTPKTITTGDSTFEYVADDFQLSTNAYYNAGAESKLPTYDYDLDSNTGEVWIRKHFYVTYKDVTPPAPSSSVPPASSSSSVPPIPPTSSEPSTPGIPPSPSEPSSPSEPADSSVPPAPSNSSVPPEPPSASEPSTPEVPQNPSKPPAPPTPSTPPTPKKRDTLAKTGVSAPLLLSLVLLAAGVVALTLRKLAITSETPLRRRR